MSVLCTLFKKAKVAFVSAFVLAALAVTAHGQQVCADHCGADRPAVLADGGGNWIGGGGGTGP